MLSRWLFSATETATAAVTANASSGLTSLPIVSRGLLTTLFGLLGVFLVLLLFFVAIKLMQRIGRDGKTAKE